MGNVVPRSAGTERIVDHYNQALANARLREGRVKEVAEARLGSLETPLNETADHKEQAEETADSDWSAMLTRDGESDLEIGAVIDEIWNALGRVSHSPDFALIAGTGKGQWTDGEPLKQHNLMVALEKSIRQTAAGKLQDKKDGWADRIKARADVQRATSKKATESQDDLAVQKLILRGLANTAQVALARLKRDYKNDGMTEVQIHAIIPDYVRRRRGRGTGE